MLLAVLLAGCAHQKTFVSDYCMIAQPITFTETDLSCMTESLATQIEASNWMFSRMCEDGQ